MSVILFILFIVGYFFLVDKQLTSNRLIPKSYKQFMLESSVDYPGNKILIVGGSDAHHGINALMMEKAFGRPVLNLADNGGFALRHKIYNVLKYVKDGDIVIFSLGWKYYFDKRKLSEFFINAISDRNGYYSFYYENLPITKKIRFVFRDIPYKLVLKNLIRNKGGSNFSINQYLAGSDIFRKIKSKRRISRGSSVVNASDDNISYKFLSCDNSIFYINLITQLVKLVPQNEVKKVLIRAHLEHDLGTMTKYVSIAEKDGVKVNLSNVDVSPNFLGNMELVSLLRKKGVQVLFSWPIVVDEHENECYSSNLSVGLSTLSEKIKKQITDNGYQFLGNYLDSKFPSSCFYNSYNHIISSCEDIKTKKLIDALKLAAEITPDDSLYKKEYFDKVLLMRLSRLTGELDKQAEEYATTQLDVFPTNGVQSNTLRDHLLMTTGWSKQEGWGVWTDGSNSTLIMKIQNGQIPETLILKGKYYHGNKETGVYINDQKIGDFNLIESKITIPSGLINGEFVQIRLEHKSPTSPAEIYPDTDDFRLLAYGLIFINVKYAEL